MQQYLVSQRQAVEMIRGCGLSRRAAYYRLESVPYRILVDAKVYSRIDVELLCEELRGTIPASPDADNDALHRTATLPPSAAGGDR